MLPGLDAVLGFMEGGSDLSFTFVGYATGTGSSISLASLSSGVIAAGDFCVILNAAWNNGGTAISSVTPSGFTSAQSNSVTGGAFRNRGIISAKILSGLETTLTGMSSSAQGWIALVFRPSEEISTFNWSGNGEATTGNPSSQSIGASAVARPVISMGQMQSTGAIDPRTISPSMSERSSSTTHYAHYRVDNSAPQDTSYDMDDEGNSNLLQSGYFTFT